MKNTIYLVSGPAGVGKSTTSKILVQMLEKSAYISGDDISHIPVKGRKKPWECKEELRLIWLNILSLTKNLLDYKYDVVIDYVAFPEEVEWFKSQLIQRDINLIYVVLMVDQETLIYRDSLRPQENQMGERSLILLKEFEESVLNTKYILDTTPYNDTQLDQIIQEIQSNKKYLLS
jgi:hypothetical protein